MKSGWVCLYRSLFDNPRASDSDWVSIWVYLLLNASHKTTKVVFNGVVVELQPGQLITGRKSIASATGVNESKVRRVLSVLVADQQISQQAGLKSSMITVLNWRLYQETDQQNGQQPASNRPANNEKSTSKMASKTAIKNERDKLTVSVACEESKNESGQQNSHQNGQAMLFDMSQNRPHTTINNKEEDILPESLALPGKSTKVSKKKISDPELQERLDRFEESWKEAFELSIGASYVWTSADYIKARELLKGTNESPEKLVQIAIDAWGKLSNYLHDQASSVKGFVCSINPIRTALAKPQKPSGSKVSDRIALENQRKRVHETLMDERAKQKAGVWKKDREICETKIAECEKLLQSIDTKLAGMV